MFCVASALILDAPEQHTSRKNIQNQPCGCFLYVFSKKIIIFMKNLSQEGVGCFLGPFWGSFLDTFLFFRTFVFQAILGTPAGTANNCFFRGSVVI